MTKTDTENEMYKKTDKDIQEIGDAVLEAVKQSPHNLTKEKFKNLVLFILYNRHISKTQNL